MLAYDMTFTLSRALMSQGGWAAVVRFLSSPQEDGHWEEIIELLAKRIYSVGENDGDELTRLWVACGRPEHSEPMSEWSTLTRMAEALIEYASEYMTVDDVAFAAGVDRSSSKAIRVGDLVITDGESGRMGYTYIRHPEEHWTRFGDVIISRDIPWAFWGDQEPGFWRVTGFRRRGSRVFPELEAAEPTEESMSAKLAGRL